MKKLNVLRKWGNTTIQTEIRPRLGIMQDKCSQSNDVMEVYKIAQILVLLKPEIEKAKAQLLPFDFPPANLSSTKGKIDQLKIVTAAAIGEINLTVRGIQKLLDVDDSQSIVSMVQVIKSFKVILDANQLL